VPGSSVVHGSAGRGAAPEPGRFIDLEHHDQVDRVDGGAFPELSHLPEHDGGRDGIPAQFVRELFNQAQTSYPDGSLKEGRATTTASSS